MSAPELSDKTALVTGGGRGIGRATAEALAAAGAKVIVVARGETQLNEAVSGIAALGGQATAARADLSKRRDIEDLFAGLGPIDILVNNAATIQPVSPVAATAPEDWEQSLALNLNAIFLTCRLSLPGMLQRNWGRIVNVSSGAARGSVTSWSAYSAAKAGVETFTRVLASEVEGSGVYAYAVRPGIVDTEMQAEVRASSPDQFGADNLDRFQGYKARGLLRDPKDAARLIFWLLGDEARSLHGETVTIDDPEIAAQVGLTPMER